MWWEGGSAVAAVSHGAAALAFGWLAVWLLRGVLRAQQAARAVAAAAAGTALWAASAVVAALMPTIEIPSSGAAWPDVALLDAPEALRVACWLALLLVLAGAGRRLVAAAAMLPAAAVAVTVLVSASPLLRAGLSLSLSVLGMLLVEHLYRSTRRNARWGIKFACLGMGALFAYDFYLYSDAMLLRRVNPDIWAARGIVNALSVPLLVKALVRGPAWTPGLRLSRQMMFHSAALLGSALYLLSMAASAWYLRSIGGAWGMLMQVACLCGAALLLVALLFSGALRARLKLFIGKHFYQGRYDYRDEWQRFTNALADDADGLPERAIQALAALVESPGGILWLRHEDAGYRASARWNVPLPSSGELADGALASFLAAGGWVIEVPEWRAHPELYDHLRLPAWSEDFWLIVPLMLDRGLFGFICLAPPRTALHVNWEVRDVLKIAASQAASYLAHRASADSLAVARQFESFNRMSTFIVHDLKNLVSQLSLLLLNAEKHKANPEFQEDMLDTLSHSLGKMKQLLLKLRRDQAPDAVTLHQLDQLLMRAVQSHAGSEPAPSLDLRASGLVVRADGGRLERVIGHLIQNAIEATPRAGRVLLRLHEHDGAAVIELSDTGQGMSEEFMRAHLFQPFLSTKAAGMGIGVFESREYVREIGGQLHVTSAPSKGTTFRITLPLHKEYAHGEK